MGTHVRERESHVPSRRDALRTIGISGLVAAAPISAVALAGEPHPDAELVRLGAEFERAHADATALRRAYREAWDRCRGILDAGGDRLTMDSWRGACRESGISEIDDALDDANAAIEALAGEIRRIPARTIAGISVKARVVFEEVFSGYQEGGPGYLTEGDVRCYAEFMHEIAALARELRA